jgi:Calcineurin-like phosphoesterase
MRGVAVRTIVFSDVHGEPDIIAAVLTHSGFDAGIDRLVFAGDAIEVGRDSSRCLDLLEELGAECLVGNHEYGAFTGHPVEEEPPDPALVERVAESITSGRWRLAASAGGVLITHAGVDKRFAVDLGPGEADAAEFIARVLNDQFETAVASRSRKAGSVVGYSGPLWWRPGLNGDPVPGVIQVAGHTPPEMMAETGAAAHWAQKGILLIDPYVRGWRMRGFVPPTPIRYAVIEDGAVRVVLNGE